MIGALRNKHFVEREEDDEEQWPLKHPIEICQSGTSPFFEGEAELQNPPNIAPVCMANIHRQKNGSLEQTYCSVRSAGPSQCENTHPDMPKLRNCIQ